MVNSKDFTPGRLVTRRKIKWSSHGEQIDDIELFCVIGVTEFRQKRMPVAFQAVLVQFGGGIEVVDFTFSEASHWKRFKF